MTARRIGVFGGAFDPPHHGHVVLARVALEQLHLDELRIIPTGQAWHKARALTDAKHRLAMCSLAFGALGRVVVDDRETLRAGPSYTVDTLRELHAECPGASLYLVLGEDQGMALPHWNRADDIPKLATVCVAARAGLARLDGDFDALLEHIPSAVALLMPAIPLSSTGVRRAVQDESNVTPLVFEPVARYIDLHHLYQDATP